MNEMEQMRMQIALLKERLDREKIVNNEIMRRAMRDNVRWLNRRSVGFIILSLVMVPIVVLESEFLSLSKEWCYVTCGFFIISAVYTHLMQTELDAYNLSDSNLLTTQRAVARFKRLNARWLFFSTPFLILWCMWLIYEVKDLQYADSVIIGLFVGLLIGLPVGIYTYRSMQRTASEILNQIEELTKE